MKKRLVVITGPTASGKTQVAVDLANALQTEIVSFDSRQFFKEMNIGTAKPTDQQLEAVRHHFIGHLSIEQDYDAGAFEADADQLLQKLFEEHDTVIATGGSGMYLDALLFGFDPLPKVDQSIRNDLERKLTDEGIESLQQKLKELDPTYYEVVDLNNPHRLIRALEICIATDKPYSALRKGKAKPRSYNVQLFGLDVPREELYDGINQRVDAMMEAGLLEEVKGLLSFKDLNALQTVGYKELFAHLKGEMELTEAVGQIKQNTRRYAKRQITWFRKYEDLIWVSPKEAVDKILLLITHSS